MNAVMNMQQMMRHICQIRFKTMSSHATARTLSVKPLVLWGWCCPRGLGEYYHDLTAGRTPSIPEEFATHRSLDEYVEKSNLGEMSQGDLEFILAMYFRFHLELKDKLRKEKRLRDSWKCNKATCHMDMVERLLNTKTSLIYKFKEL